MDQPAMQSGDDQGDGNNGESGPMEDSTTEPMEAGPSFQDEETQPEDSGEGGMEGGAAGEPGDEGAPGSGALPDTLPETGPEMK